jgi:riboflavin synthase
MFTGLIEAVCPVSSVIKKVGAVQLDINLGELPRDCKTGDSIAVSGVCLTITKLANSTASFDVSPETLSKSTLSRLKTGSQVNIERAMGPKERFGGHFVLGHIDGVATIKSIDRRGQFADIRFTAGKTLLDAIVPKGSVAIDGISLTIAELDKTGFSVAVIPQTLEKTTLSKVKPGDMVNIETDIIVKTVKKQLEQILPQTQGLTAEKLREMGF